MSAKLAGLGRRNPRPGTSDDPHIRPSELFNLQVPTHAAVAGEKHLRRRLDARGSVRCPPL